METVEQPGESARAPRTTRRRVLIALGVVAGVVLLAFGALYLWARSFELRTPYTGREPIAFSREAWRQGEHDWYGSRFLMMNDLIAKHRLIGMDRTSVIELLGPFPASTPVSATATSWVRRITSPRSTSPGSC